MKGLVIRWKIRSNGEPAGLMDVVDERPPQRCWTEAVPCASSTWRRPLQVLMGIYAWEHSDQES